MKQRLNTNEKLRPQRTCATAALKAILIIKSKKHSY